MKSNFFKTLAVAAFCTILTFGLTVSLQTFLRAWNEPSGLPPAESGAGLAQVWQPGTGAESDEIHYDSGNVGIGVSDPDVPLDVNGKIQSNVAVGDITGNKDVATREYVLAQSGSAQWAGYTAAVDGHLGNSTVTGVKQGHILCNSTHPGSHWCSYEEIMALGSSYPYSAYAWLRDGVSGVYTFYEDSVNGAGYLHKDGGFNTYQGYGMSCNFMSGANTSGAWQSNHSNRYATYLNTSGVIGVSECDNIYRVPCCE